MRSLFRNYRIVFLHFLYRLPKPFVWLFIRLFRRKKPNSIAFRYQQYAKNKKLTTLLQVGANDGLINDPLVDLIHLYAVKAVLIEPQIDVFNRFLIPLYKNKKNIQLENTAIDKVNGSQTLYTISFSKKRWATGLASFEKQKLENSIQSGYVQKMAFKYNDTLPSDINSWITAIQIPTVNFESLLTKYNINQLDILQIDAEGYDIELIKMFPFHLLKPSVIGFELDHSSHEQVETIKSQLSGLGYSFEICNRDAFAKLDE